MPRKTGRMPEKSSRPAASSAPELPITGDGRKKTTEPTVRARLKAVEGELLSLNALLIELQGNDLEREKVLGRLEVQMPTADRLSSERDADRVQLLALGSRIDRVSTDLLAKIGELERQPSIPAYESNRRTRRYAVVSHDRALEYIDKRFSSATERLDFIWAGLQRLTWDLFGEPDYVADDGRIIWRQHGQVDELFERLQAVEQYIRADHAIQNSFRYTNTERERAERAGWRRYREAALEKIGRITNEYVRRND